MRIATIVVFGLSACLLALPTAAQTGKPPSQADMTNINDISQTYVKAVLDKDWTTLAGLYVEDAILNPPNESMVKGRASIRTYMENALAQVTGFTLSNLKVDGRDDLAYVWGTYTMTITPPGGAAPLKDQGKYVEIRRKQRDGRWLIAIDIFNSDLPGASPK